MVPFTEIKFGLVDEIKSSVWGMLKSEMSLRDSLRHDKQVLDV